MRCLIIFSLCSLAGLVRFEFDSSKVQEMRARTSVLFALARELKLLSDIFKIAVVVVNQVSSRGKVVDWVNIILYRRNTFLCV